MMINKVWRVSPDGTRGALATIAETARGLDWTGGTTYSNFFYVIANTSLVRVALDRSKFPLAAGFPAATEVAVDRTDNYGRLMYVATKFGYSAPAKSGIFALSTNGTATRFANGPRRFSSAEEKSDGIRHKATYNVAALGAVFLVWLTFVFGLCPGRGAGAAPGL